MTEYYCNTLGETPYYVPYFESMSETFTTNVGVIVDCLPTAPTGKRIHLAPNHQDYTLDHRQQRRSKFKRPGRG